MQGQFVFLNENHYTKDGDYRCYASFADSQGKVLNFNACAANVTFPEPFTVCDLDFDMQVFGKSQALIMNKLNVIGTMQFQKGDK